MARSGVLGDLIDLQVGAGIVADGDQTGAKVVGEVGENFAKGRLGDVFPTAIVAEPVGEILLRRRIGVLDAMLGLFAVVKVAIAIFIVPGVIVVTIGSAVFIVIAPSQFRIAPRQIDGWRF